MKIRRHIGFLMTVLLLMCGLANEAYAYTVTYHILTMPFTTHDKDDDNTYTNDPFDNPHSHPTDVTARQNVRVEALYVVNDTATTVGLPSQYKSPLAHNFRYYPSNAITRSGSRVQIYQYNTTTFYTYKIDGTENNTDNDATKLTPGSAITEDCDIYVTYEYNPGNGIIDLTGNMSYNIKLGDRY